MRAGRPGARVSISESKFKFKPVRSGRLRPVTRPPAREPGARKRLAAGAARPASRRGDATRLRLLAAAGEVFAELGFASGTTKEIARRAGTPMASVNYHFGSRQALYEAVLIEAHGQMLDLDELRAIAVGDHEPDERLRLLLARLAALAASPAPPWGFRVLAREAMSPSAAISALVDEAARPKAAFLLAIVAGLLGLDPQQPAVQRAAFLAVLPAIVLMIAPRQSLREVLPSVLQDPQALQDDLVRYVQGGLAALKAARAGTFTAAPAAARIASARGRRASRSPEQRARRPCRG